MISLFLSIIMSVIIANLLPFFKKDTNIKILQIFLGNYFLATIFSFLDRGSPLSQAGNFEIIIGSITGILFLTTFLIYQHNITKNGVSLSVGAMRFSVVIPIIMAFFVFGEPLLLLNITGIILVLLAFAFLTDTKSFHSILWLGLLFLFTGIIDSIMKFYEQYGLESTRPFMIYIFGSALIFNLFVVLYKKTPFHLKSFCLGMILGIPNRLTTKYFLDALQEIPATMVYPIFAASVVVLGIFSDVLIWKKKFNYMQKIALLIMVVGIVLLYINTG
jgi:drug/metabolite transporter (DMT)-like permease